MAIETVTALSHKVKGKDRHKIRAAEGHLDSGTDIGTPTWWGHQIISSLKVVIFFKQFAFKLLFYIIK